MITKIQVNNNINHSTPIFNQFLIKSSSLKKLHIYSTCNLEKGIFVLKNNYSNLFINFSDSKSKTLYSFSLGSLNFRKKKLRKLKINVKKILHIIYDLIAKFDIFNLQIVLKGQTKRLFKYYKFFHKYYIFDLIKFQIKNTKPHGGCRPKSRRRK